MRAKTKKKTKGNKNSSGTLMTVVLFYPLMLGLKCATRFLDFIVAFHPYKEIIFFDTSSSRVLAYHLSSSKLEVLGKLLPTNKLDPSQYMRSCFIYTPCWMDG